MEKENRWREHALIFGKHAAKLQFDGRKGHGGNPVLSERHYSLEQVTALMAAAWEAGAEYATDSYRAKANASTADNKAVA